MHANQTLTVEFVGVIVTVPQGVAPLAYIDAPTVAIPLAVRIASS